MKDKDIEAKIDDLAEMVARGFTEVRGEMHDIREGMVSWTPKTRQLVKVEPCP